jgi:hypothetical protein
MDLGDFESLTIDVTVTIDGVGSTIVANVDCTTSTVRQASPFEHVINLSNEYLSNVDSITSTAAGAGSRAISQHALWSTELILINSIGAVNTNSASLRACFYYLISRMSIFICCRSFIFRYLISAPEYLNNVFVSRPCFCQIVQNELTKFYKPL